MQESEAVARMLRELCVRNSIALPADLDGSGGTGTIARGETQRSVEVPLEAPCQVANAATTAPLVPVMRAEQRQEGAAPVGAPVTVEASTQSFLPPTLLEPVQPVAPVNTVEEPVAVRAPI